MLIIIISLVLHVWALFWVFVLGISTAKGARPPEQLVFAAISGALFFCAFALQVAP